GARGGRDDRRPGCAEPGAGAGPHVGPPAQAPRPAITSLPAFQGGRQDCAAGFGHAHTAAGWLYVPESWWRLASQEQVTGRGWPLLCGAEAGPDRDRAAPRPACLVTCRPASRGGGWRFRLTLRNWPVLGKCYARWPDQSGVASRSYIKGCSALGCAEIRMSGGHEA